MKNIYTFMPHVPQYFAHTFSEFRVEHPVGTLRNVREEEVTPVLLFRKWMQSKGSLNKIRISHYILTTKISVPSFN